MAKNQIPEKISPKKLYIEYFSCVELLQAIDLLLSTPFFKLSSRKTPDEFSPNKVYSSIVGRSLPLSFNHSEFRKLVKERIKSLIADKEPSKKLESLVRIHAEKMKESIIETPNSIDKAVNALEALFEVENFTNSDQFLDAMVLLNDRVSPEIVQSVIKDWKRDIKSHEERKEFLFPYTNIFWVSRDFNENIDAISRYRFRETFDIGEFETTFREVEYMLEEHLLENAGAPARSLAYDLWLLSRSKGLSSRMREIASIVLRNISKEQHSDGFWPHLEIKKSIGRDPKTGNEILEPIADSHLTAICTLVLLKLSNSEPLQQNGKAGAKWLLDKQHPEGSWLLEPRLRDLPPRPDIFITILSIEALVRSGMKNISTSINLGIDWVMSQQNELGLWEEEGTPFPFLTVLVLELILKKDYLGGELTSYLYMGKGFINRAIQFALEDDSNSQQLSIISAYHGVEAFLYSILSHRSINIRIFETKDETLGYRKALTRFQDYLQSKKKLDKSQVLPFRNSLDQLAYLRDQVVHKGLLISKTVSLPLIKDAQHFVSLYCREIFGYDIFG